MFKLLKKIYTNDKVLFTLPCVYLLCAVAYETIGICTDPHAFSFFELLLEILNILIVFSITFAYQKQEKNIMKVLLGAVLMERTIFALNWASFAFENQTSTTYKVFSLLYLCTYLLFFADHIFLNAGHDAKPGIVRMNWFIAVIIIVVMTLWAILVPDFFGGSAIKILAIVTESSLISEILCIEVKLDSFKTMRNEKVKAKKKEQ